jgi:hypothetical protein
VWWHSSVWRDALDIASLPRKETGLALAVFPPALKKRKLEDSDNFKLTESVEIMKIVFGLLSDDPAKINQAVTLDHDYERATYIHNVTRVISVADKYDLPLVHQRFLEKLWAVATQSKEHALMVYSIAHQEQNVPLARHAMRNFKDMCHPIRLSDDTISGGITTSRVWRFLVRAMYDYREVPVDWAKVADKVVYPAR